MFFGVDVFNRTGRNNIRGDELAALIAPAGANALLGITIQQGDTQSIPDDVFTPIDWGAGLPGDPANVTFDDLNFYRPENQTDALEIPANVNRVACWFGCGWANSAVGNRNISIFRNPTSSIPGAQGIQYDAQATISQTYNISSGIIPVSEGDLISFRVKQTTGGNLTATPTAKASLWVMG